VKIHGERRLLRSILRTNAPSNPPGPKIEKLYGSYRSMRVLKSVQFFTPRLNFLIEANLHTRPEVRIDFFYLENGFDYGQQELVQDALLVERMVQVRVVQCYAAPHQVTVDDLFVLFVELAHLVHRLAVGHVRQMICLSPSNGKIGNI
jgi:hypothetical protein